MRARPLVLAGLLLAAGCGGGSHSSGGVRDDGTLAGLLARAGDDVAIVSGTSDYAPGPLRVSFLVVRRDGEVVNRPRARVWLARGLRAKPFAETSATLESVGVPGGSVDAQNVTHLYVAHLRAPRPGKYWLLAEPVGGRPIQAVGNVVVGARTDSPAVGAKAYASRTPTIASTHGDLEMLTTLVPPDRALVRYSVAETLAARKPFVLVFATPKFCTSRTCGPVVDVVDAARRRFAGKGIRFIHVEIYKDNSPSLGQNRWVKQWRLPSEPWTFLVGRDGRIKAKFEGSFSLAELSAAIRGKLV